MSLVKGIIALINDIWFKRNNVVHGEKVPQPDQDLISDSQAIVSFSSLPFSSSLKPQLSSSNLLSFSMNLASWNLFIRKWKFNCPSFCCISIRNHKRPLQSFTWKRHHVSGDIFSLACFRLALKWIHCSNLPLDDITIWNVHKRLIDFSAWAPSIHHTVARDVAELIKFFHVVNIGSISISQYNSFIYSFSFMDIIKLM